MPEERESYTRHIELGKDGEHSGYITVGMLPNGKPGELFIKVAKMGTMERGLLDGIGVLSSLCLQYGVPPEVLIEKMAGTCFEPDFWMNGRHYCSVLDYIFRSFEDVCKKHTAVAQPHGIQELVAVSATA